MGVSSVGENCIKIGNTWLQDRQMNNSSIVCWWGFSNLQMHPFLCFIKQVFCWNGRLKGDFAKTMSLKKTLLIAYIYIRLKQEFVLPF